MNFENETDAYELLKNFNFTNFEMGEYSELDSDEHPLMRIISAIFLFSMILIGIFGNLMIIHIITIKWRIQMAFNLFLVNLAIADILFTSATSLSLITHMFLGEFIFGDVMCKVIAFFEHFGPILSILTIITALIVVQFNVGIVVSTIIIIFLCIVSSLPSLLQMVWFQTIDTYSTDKGIITVCLRSFSSADVESGFFEIDKIFQIKLPAAVLIVYVILWIVQRFIVGVKTLGGFVYDRLLILMAMIYILLWTPALYFLHNSENWDIYQLGIIQFAVNILTGFSVIYKPFLYMCMHQGLQREFQKYVANQTPDLNNFV